MVDTAIPPFRQQFDNARDPYTARNALGIVPAPSGSFQPLDATLSALAAYNTNGLLTQTAPDTFTGRTITAPAAGITVSNGNGVAGNPTLALADDLAALEALSGTSTIYYRSGTSAWTAVTIGTGLTFSAGNLAADTTTLTGRNRIINGQGKIFQRASGGVDNAYGIDRWRSLSETTSTVIYANNFDIAAFIYYMAIQQAANGTDKFGFFQVIEGINCKDLRGKTVTLSMLLSINNARIGNLKIGILEWTGTEDATSGDPVTTWGANGVTPTLAANWAFKNTPANLGVAAITNSSATWTPCAVTVTLGTTFNNLAVMVWNDDKSFTAGDNFAVSNVQLEQGNVATTYEFRPHEIEFGLCQRYYENTYDLGVPPASATHNGMVGPDALGDGTNAYGHSIRFLAAKRAAPSLLIWDGAGNSDKASRYLSGAWQDNVIPTIGLPAMGQKGFVLDFNNAALGAFLIHYAAIAEI